MTEDQMSWDEFYKKIEGREPRPLLRDVLDAFANEDIEVIYQTDEVDLVTYPDIAS